ncbi:TspO and MBR related proteins [Sphingomonas guangdongensis]|uniref:TspO and MBR related proteins n=1 Tax=Sphingomonas guangdongensis TaxID=1141890 RepID=A0A285QAJ9_9SPHN|nr:TspO/MBR family protein [Sphingomonas guangdongensis]SOB78514.1 TspO and MBR related proteins [Sphingomonas guangdongensis]
MRELASKGQLRAAYLRWAVVTVPLVLLLGFASASLAPSGDENAWYQALVKGPANPPNWAFPVVWSILYVLLGLALAMVINARRARGRGLALLLFVVQLALNLAWTPLFFGAHRITASLLLIAALFATALVTCILFGRVRRTAGWLLVPYLAWIAFAGALLWDIHRLNPDAENLVPSGATTQMTI